MLKLPIMATLASIHKESGDKEDNNGKTKPKKDETRKGSASNTVQDAARPVFHPSSTRSAEG